MRLPFGLTSPGPAELRPATMRDAADCAVLHGQAFARPWSTVEFEGLLADSQCLGHVAAGRSGLQAFVLSRMAADEAEILSIAVDRARRKQGLASRLLSQHLRDLERARIRRLFLEVDEGNAAARALYARFGFREVGRRPGYYPLPDGKTATALILRRDGD